MILSATILPAMILPAGGEILNAIFRSDVIGCDIFGKSVYQIFFVVIRGRKTSLLKGM